MSSAEQVNRIVSLVAELTRRSQRGEEDTPIAELAERFGTTRRQIEADVRAMTRLGDDSDADWLLSLSAFQEGDRISLRSGGPFRRPIRFTRDELVAVQMGLLAEEGAPALSSALASLLLTSERPPQALQGGGRVIPPVSTLVRRAITDRRKVEIRYTGERSIGGINRVIHPYQVLEDGGHTYIVAWCELANGWRHFRADRVLDALVMEGYYTPRPDFTPPSGSFHPPADGTTPVQVRFSPAIARWIRERHPDAVVAADGGVVVTYQVASPEWLVRHVLQYGAEAQVIGPDSFRELLRSHLA